MARFLKLAAVGGEPLQLSGESGGIFPGEFVCSWLQNKLDLILCDHPQLIVLPETCDIPAEFSPEEKQDYVRRRENRILTFLCRIAKSNRTYLAYPTIRLDSDGFFRNSTYLIDCVGKIQGIYDKNKLTIGEMEELDMRCGTAPAVLDCPIGRVGLVTCFDLNFLSLQQQYQKLRPELILFSSAFHGGSLQAQWALANRAYFVSAVERLPCTVVSPTGQLLASSTNYTSSLVHTVNLDYAVLHLDFNWGKLQKAKKKYGEKIQIQDPGLLGAVLLTSETREFSVADVMKEFEMESLDCYLQRAEALQKQYQK